MDTSRPCDRSLPADPAGFDGLRMEHVSYGSEGRSRALNDVSLTIPRGAVAPFPGFFVSLARILILVCAGKSTILRLLLRFYAPMAGEIRINGILLEQISFAELHRRIAFLEQDTYLFDATIAENIGIAKPGATREEIRTAARRAGIGDFIETLPQGYDTDMGQMSARLSGGERQRIGIARVLLRDPDVCLMDEPSSALDALHERELLHTLETEYAGKTLPLISHRQSTLAGCTRLLKMEQGKAIPL